MAVAERKGGGATGQCQRLSPQFRKSGFPFQPPSHVPEKTPVAGRPGRWHLHGFGPNAPLDGRFQLGNHSRGFFQRRQPGEFGHHAGAELLAWQRAAHRQKTKHRAGHRGHPRVAVQFHDQGGPSGQSHRQRQHRVDVEKQQRQAGRQEINVLRSSFGRGRPVASAAGRLYFWFPHHSPSSVLP